MHGMQAQMQQLQQGVACVEGQPFSFLSGLTALRLCAHFSDRGRRFSLIVDGVSARTWTGVGCAQAMV